MLAVWGLGSRPSWGRRGRGRQSGRVCEAGEDYHGAECVLGRRIVVVPLGYEGVLTLRPGCIPRASSGSVNMVLGGRTSHHQQRIGMVIRDILTRTRLSLQREQPCLDLLWWTIDGILMVGVGLGAAAIHRTEAGPCNNLPWPSHTCPLRVKCARLARSSQPRPGLIVGFTSDEVRTIRYLW